MLMQIAASVGQGSLSTSDCFGGLADASPKRTLTERLECLAKRTTRQAKRQYHASTASRHRRACRTENQPSVLVVDRRYSGHGRADLVLSTIPGSGFQNIFNRFGGGLHVLFADVEGS